MHDRIIVACTLFTLASACTDAIEEADDAPVEGSTGRMHVLLGGVEQDVTYHVVDGRAIWQGDIDLGPAPPSSADHLYGIATRSLDNRWPDGVIHYQYDVGILAADKEPIERAMVAWERATPVDFIESIDPDYPTLWIVYGEHNAGHLGPDGSDPGDEGLYTVVIGTNTDSLAAHELGHVIGLSHEMNRFDRDNYVMFSEQCVQSDYADQYEIPDSDEAIDMEAFDFESVMLYSSSNRCVEVPIAGAGLAHNNCTCYPLVKR
ncbi:MAG TPA: M12 family metallopeptidase, partial [Kofleriaceae bacterium]|nr:M12 family metallopeptidase [Kofleriaceae bacterium]